VLKVGGYSLHCFDIVIKKNEVRANNLLPFMFQNYKTINKLIPLSEIQHDEDIFYMSEKAYVNGWEKFTNKPYEVFGKPVSYNILWKKQYSYKSKREITRSDEQFDTKQNDKKNENIDLYTGNEIGCSTFKVKSTAPRISIVTPSYNQNEFLEECIDSILSQNYPNLEYIIMDGGSTDGSVEIIKKYEKYLAYWQSKPDGGQYAAISQGFKKSTGEIMGWLNSDDKYHENSLFKTTYIFEQNPLVEWITGRPTAWNENGELVRVFEDLPLWDRKKYLKKIFKNICIQQESTFWRKSLWLKAGSYLRTDLQFAGDLELWIRFFRYARLYTIDTMLGGYRYQPNQKTKLFMQKYIEEGEQIVDQEISEIHKEEFPLMLDAPQPICFKESEFNQYKRSLLTDKKETHHANFRPHRNYIPFLSNSNSSPIIATSISPQDIDKQQQAIQSWLNIGFKVVSMNCGDEINIINQYFPEVEFISADRNAMQSKGKPFVYIDDLFHYLKKTGAEVSGIVNSDIYLLQDRTFLNFIKKEARNSLIYGSRIDVESFCDLQGDIYDRGFDAFFFSNSVFSNIPPSEFCLGTTWWDYWVPLVLSLKKYSIKKIVYPFVFHKKHPYNWNRKEFVNTGRKVLEFLYDQSLKEINLKCHENNWISFNLEFLKFLHNQFSKNTFTKDEKDLLLFRYTQSFANYVLKFLRVSSAELKFPEKTKLPIRGGIAALKNQMINFQ
jgi:glycosyltransferase involved in cell wall biosynthesis